MDAQRKDICRVSVEYRSMCRSTAGRVSTDISTDTGPILDRHSANIRSTLGRCVDRVSTATRPTYRPSVDRWCRPIVSTDTTYSKHDPINGRSKERYRPSVGRVSIECRSSADLVSANISTDTGPILGRHSANIRRHSADMMTECRPLLSRHIGRVSTDSALR